MIPKRLWFVVIGLTAIVGPSRAVASGTTALDKALTQFTPANLRTHFESFALEAELDVTFDRGLRSLRQHDTFVFRQAVSGVEHARVETSRNQTEVYTRDSDAFIRHNHGPLRKVPPQDADLAHWRATTLSSLQETLGLFGPGITPGKSRARRLGRRNGHRLALLRTAPSQIHRAVSDATPWRGRVRVKSIEGHIDVDEETGMILGASIQGHLEVDDHDVDPTRISVRYTLQLTDLDGDVRIKIPKRHVAEYSPARINRQLLGFIEK